MIRTETYCDACNTLIETEHPPWATVSVVIFPEKTPRVFHFCAGCYPQTTGVPEWAKPLHQNQTHECNHPLGNGNTLAECLDCKRQTFIGADSA